MTTVRELINILLDFDMTDEVKIKTKEGEFIQAYLVAIKQDGLCCLFG